MEKTDLGINGGICYGTGVQPGSVFCLSASVHRESAGSPDAFASDLRYHNQPGHYGGKGSKNDKSAIVGDTIGDPFKDTSGPAINILIKLLSMVSIVFATVVVNFHMFG